MIRRLGRAIRAPSCPTLNTFNIILEQQREQPGAGVGWERPSAVLAQRPLKRALGQDHCLTGIPAKLRGKPKHGFIVAFNKLANSGRIG